MESKIITPDTPKPRYELLDGLRGVAALIVIIYHFGEGFATSPVDQWCNHGYLAVDFFFVLSGFVLGYAYDDRWRSGLVINVDGEALFSNSVRMKLLPKALRLIVPAGMRFFGNVSSAIKTPAMAE